MFGHGSKNENIATANNGGIAIAEMKDSKVTQNNTTIIQNNITYQLPPNFYELYELGRQFSSKLDQQIDKVKELINLGKIQKALEKINEIEEIYQEKLTTHHKFRLTTDQGIIYSIRNECHNAANKLLKAFELEQNEISYANRILAYTLLKDDEKLNQSIKEAKTAFPYSKSIYSQIIMAYRHNKSIKSLHNINDDIFTDAVCCLMASSFYAEKKDFHNALKMAQRANDIKPNDWQIMANLGCYLISDVFFNRINYSLLTDEQFNNIQQAQLLFEKSWDIVKDSEYPFDFISYIPINLFSLYSLQQNKEKANGLLEILYEKLPNNPNIAFQKIIRNLDKITEEDLLKLQPRQYNEHAKLLADIYINKGDYNKALKNIMLAPDKNDIFTITTQAYCLSKLHNYSEITKLKKRYKDEAIKAIIDFAYSGDINFLLNAKNYDIRDELKLYIAQSLYGNSRYREAADIFQSVIKHKDLKDVFYRQYLDCLAQINHFVELKKQLSNFSKDNMDDWVLCLLGCTYAGISDFSEARNIFKILYETHRDEAVYICNYLISLIKLNDKSKIVAVLNNINVDIYRLQGDIRYKYGIISYINDYIDQQKALEQIYMLTINNMKEVEAWNQYFMFMFENHIERDDKTAYEIQDLDSQSIKRYFVDDNIELQTKYFDVIKIQDAIAENLLSHQQGDVIQVNSSVNAIIKNVNDKYMVLLKIISENIFLEFPNNNQIERISANTPEELLSYLKNMSEAQKKNWNVCQRIYNSGFPISLLAGMMKKDVFSVLETLQLSHLNVAQGTPQEINEELKNCSVHDKYIIDTVTIYNIFVFNLQNILIPLQNKIYIAQSTKSNFISIIEKIQESITAHASRLQTNIETGQVYMLTPEQLKNASDIELQRLRDILYWIESNAIVVKAKYEAEFNEEQNKILSLFSEFGNEIIEIIDIAVEKKLTLISDDLHLRNFAKTFDINSIWLQVLLKLKKVSEIVYNDYLKAAIYKHHTFISLTAQDLIYCIRNDNTEDLEEFSALASMLGSSSAVSAALVIQSTLESICFQYPKYAKLYVYNIIINAYLQNGTCLDMEERLKNLHLLGNRIPSFRKALNLWTIGHFIFH